MKGRERAHELLFEIGCEEIPAGMIARASAELKAALEKYLTAENLLAKGGVETFGGPRRLVAVAGSVRAKQPDTSKEVSGPPKAVAYDNVGRPTRAAESFAEKQGVPLSETYTITTPKGEYLAVKQRIPGRTAQAILAEWLPRVIQELSWPRTMTWTGGQGPRFIRPVRWIVAVLGGEAVRFRSGDVESGAVTRGHRTLGKARIPVRNFREYENKLRANGVLIRQADRKAKVEREIQALTKGTGLRVHVDEELLRTVTFLNECPTVILGNFDEAFLDLPDEILLTVMRDHQKYFGVERKSGELAPHFLAVINLDSDRKGKIRAGHERVLRARFADARFFWESDQKCRLADFLPRLAEVTYGAKLGNYRDKVERVRTNARWLAEQWFNSGLTRAHVPDADRAAELAKCDLASEMVREFTELQGIVGGLYARVQGEPQDIADAVYDHYRPVGLDDPIPRNLTGCAVALADKLDSIVACFAVGRIPSGSSDPYALRRAALGIVKIILERRLPVVLSLTVAAASRAMANLPPKVTLSPEAETQALEFILERARFILKEREGFAYDEINAVFRAGADDLVDAVRRLEALRAIRKTKNFEPLAVSFKRIRKILEKAHEAAGDGKKPSPELFEHETERQLYAAVREAATKVDIQKRAGRYRDALETIAGLRQSVDRFFEDVLVMAENEAVRRNRLSLLAELLREFTTIADFSEIAADERGSKVSSIT
jgi:glycyl-tRNA synthetase beta chain